MSTDIVSLFAFERCRTQLAQISGLLHLKKEGCTCANDKAILHLIRNIERDLNAMSDHMLTD